MSYWRKLLFIGKLGKAPLAVQILVHTGLHAFVEIYCCPYIVPEQTDSIENSANSSTQMDIYVGVSTEIQDDKTCIDLSENSKCQLCD